ncbi:hypothetical protein [uncultured Winogradskyella sp.]|uniref:hypothetical protein n=1 Tax=uncultured Winogradskyella sp. TaxID=395353 RepID=UPI0035156CA1
MKDKKHIDRLFQEKFKDFEVSPDEKLWSRIESDLPKRKKKRRPVVIWWQLGGVAAAILLLITVGISLLRPDKTQPEDYPLVNTKTVDSSSILKKENTSTNNKNTVKNSVADTDNETDLEASENKTLTPSASARTNVKSENKVASHTRSTPTNESSKGAVTNAVVADNPLKTKKENRTSENKILNKKDLNEDLKESLDSKKNAVAENQNNTETAPTNATKSKVEDGIIKKDEALLKEELKKQSIEEAIAAQEDKTNEKEKVDQSRWSISPNVAPVYFSSLGQGSPINEQFIENSKGSNVSMSYGISGSYAVTDRVKVRVGVNRINLNQVTSDVFAFSGVEASETNSMARMENVDYMSSSESYAIMSSAMMNRVSSPELFNPKISGQLEQRFGFLEVPLELEYRIMDKKFGVNVIGGFSTFFLNDNELYAEVNGTSTLIGEANNINSTSFSANFGLGMDYSLSKQWKINLEPMFKYQINTFSNTSGDFRPFFIGVYSGLSFKF